jgi:cell division protein FtsB
MDSSVSYAARLRDFAKANVRTIFLIGFMLLALQDIFGTHGVVAMRKSQKEAAQIRQEIKQLNDENRQLDQRVKDLKSDPRAVEEIARQNMGLARPGEYIFKVAPKSPDASGSPTPTAPDASSTPASH